ncbi:hypothetical protein J2X60_003018 [Curtobacterium sp. 320]|uniref:hypothetical protein n=1 Tax=Curtobacterium sp. 320 TaxID=2817749 RepID=UPI002867039F|nr:hypothetical protein [Curtobacterium sp. 320]MDR6574359.1 hypothetical protein [Curtobacterium sp. 320]
MEKNMDFNDKLAKAKQSREEQGPPTRTVTVTLDQDVSTRLVDLEAQLEAEKQRPQDGRLAKKSPIAVLQEQIDAVKAEYIDTLVDLKFTRMEGTGWNDLTIINPPREDSLPDKLIFGYNIHAVTRAAAVVSGVLIEDDQERELTQEQWDDLFVLLSGKDNEKIANAIYALNEGESERAVELGKALRDETRASEKKSA